MFGFVNFESEKFDYECFFIQLKEGFNVEYCEFDFMVILKESIILLSFVENKRVEEYKVVSFNFLF